jgi:hypothetical protein
MIEVFTLIGSGKERAKIFISGTLNIVKSVCREEPLADDLLIRLFELWLLTVLYPVEGVKNHSIFIFYLYLKTYFQDICRLNIPILQHIFHFIFEDLLLSRTISLKIIEQLQNLLRLLERSHIS